MQTIRIGLTIIVLGLLALFLLRNVPTPSQNSSAQTASSTVQVQQKRITDASASIKYKIDVSYPQISGMSNDGVQTQINKAIQNRMNTDIIQFKNEVNSTEENMGNVPPQVQSFINEFYITYKVAQANEKIVSISFAVMDFQAGAAHPDNYNQVFTYDVERNKILTLADIFQPGTAYLKTLSALSRQQLSSHLKDNPFAAEMITEGTESTAEHFERFNLGQDGLILIFNPYQVAPSYAGTQTITIPYTSLKGQINPAYAQ